MNDYEWEHGMADIRTELSGIKLDNPIINLHIKQGEMIGLIGHTGSGKSSLIQHLNALLQPTSGRVTLDGVDINSSKTTRRDVRFRIGLVFQYPEYQLFEETVFQDIAFGPRNMNLSEQADHHCGCHCHAPGNSDP